MKSLQKLMLLLIGSSILMSSCSVVGGIFKAGVSVGVFLAVIVVIIIVIIAVKASGKK